MEATAWEVGGVPCRPHVSISAHMHRFRGPKPDLSPNRYELSAVF